MCISSKMDENASYDIVLWNLELLLVKCMNHDVCSYDREQKLYD